MRVRAQNRGPGVVVGEYEYKRRRSGDEFTLVPRKINGKTISAKEQFCPDWMEEVVVPTPGAPEASAAPAFGKENVGSKAAPGPGRSNAPDSPL